MLACMRLGHNVVAIEPDPFMFSVLVAHVRNYAAAMTEDLVHLTLRKNWEQYSSSSLRRPRSSGRCLRTPRRRRGSSSPTVRNLNHRSVTRKVTNTVPEPTTAEGVDVPAHDEEREVSDVEEEDDGELETQESEATVAVFGGFDADDFEDAPGVGDIPRARESAELLAQQSQGY